MKDDGEVIWKILMILTPLFKKIVKMIQLLISCTNDFTKELLLGRLEVVENKLRQSRELSRIETTFSALCINRPRSINARGDFSSNNRSKEDKNIDEVVALLVRRKKGGKKIFKYWTFNEYGHYASECPKREKKYEGSHNPRKDRDWLYANGNNDFDD